MDLSDEEDYSNNSSLDDQIMNPQPSTSSGISRSKPSKRKRLDETFEGELSQSVSDGNSRGNLDDPFENPIPSTSSGGIKSSMRGSNDEKNKKKKKVKFDYSIQDLFGSDSDDDYQGNENQNYDEEIATNQISQNPSLLETTLTANDSEPVEYLQENSNQDHNAQSATISDNLFPEILDANQNFLEKTGIDSDGYQETAERVDTSSVSSDEDLQLHISASSPSSSSQTSDEMLEKDSDESSQESFEAADTNNNNDDDTKSTSNTTAATGLDLLPLDTSQENNDSNNNLAGEENSKAKKKDMADPDFDSDNN